MLNQDSMLNRHSAFSSFRVVRHRCHDEFEQRVDECSRLAATARNDNDRKFWLSLVARWRVVESRRPAIVPRKPVRLRAAVPEW